MYHNFNNTVLHRNDFSLANKQQAEIELARSQKLREKIFHEIEATSNDLRVQTDATNFEYRQTGKALSSGELT